MFSRVDAPDAAVHDDLCALQCFDTRRFRILYIVTDQHSHFAKLGLYDWIAIALAEFEFLLAPRVYFPHILDHLAVIIDENR